MEFHILSEYKELLRQRLRGEEVSDDKLLELRAALGLDNLKNDNQIKGFFREHHKTVSRDVNVHSTILSELRSKDKELAKVKRERDNLKSVESKIRKGAYLSKKDIAYMLGVSLSQIDSWLREDNPLPSIQIKKGGAVKFKYSEIERWVEANNVR